MTADLAERIVAAGYAPDVPTLLRHGSIDLENRATRSGIWAAPSALFDDPVSYRRTDHGAEDLILHHPLLAHHPGVRALAADCGSRAVFVAEGLSHTYMRHHAWALAHDDGVDDLLATLDFTTRADIVSAVARRLAWPYDHDERPLSTISARTLLCAAGTVEPTDRSHGHRVRSGTNILKDSQNDVGADAAWSRIHGLEDGWMHHEGEGCDRVLRMKHGPTHGHPETPARSIGRSKRGRHVEDHSIRRPVHRTTDT